MSSCSGLHGRKRLHLFKVTNTGKGIEATTLLELPEKVRGVAFYCTDRLFVALAAPVYFAMYTLAGRLGARHQCIWGGIGEDGVAATAEFDLLEDVKSSAFVRTAYNGGSKAKTRAQRRSERKLRS